MVGLNLAGAGTFDAVRNVMTTRPPPRIVLVAIRMSNAQIAEALRLDVRGVLLKEEPVESLLACIRKVSAGDRWVEFESYQRAVRAVLTRQSGPAVLGQPLSERQSEIARLVGRGMPNREVAEQLSLTESTVKAHLYQAFKKLGVRSRTELALLARDVGVG